MDTPRPVAGKLFHLRREGEQRQVALYVREALRADDRALVDPDRLDPTGLTTIDWWYPSRDGSLVASCPLASAGTQCVHQTSAALMFLSIFPGAESTQPSDFTTALPWASRSVTILRMRKAI